jgi:hypothetical protein
MRIQDNQKGEIFKALATKSLVDVGYDFELDKKYAGKTGVKNAVYRVYQQVRKDPETFGVTPEAVDMVEKAMAIRQAESQKKSLEDVEAGKQPVLNPEDMKQITVGGRNKAAMLLHKKMDRISKSNKMLDKENIVSLAKVFGIFFDKAQIVQGQATEHIAVMSKISDGMTADEQMEALLKMREKTIEDKYEDK